MVQMIRIASRLATLYREIPLGLEVVEANEGYQLFSR